MALIVINCPTNRAGRFYWHGCGRGFLGKATRCLDGPLFPLPGLPYDAYLEEERCSFGRSFRGQQGVNAAAMLWGFLIAILSPCAP